MSIILIKTKDTSALARHRKIGLFLVVHTEDEEDGTIVIRFISARKAIALERKVYEEKKA